MKVPNRRKVLKLGVGAGVYAAWGGRLPAQAGAGYPSQRPPVAERKFRSVAVEQYLAEVTPKIGDPQLAALFNNCFPNTLDTTVEAGSFEGKPDTAVITGDIPAMWLRDSSAQVWPYLPLAAKDADLRRMLEGIIRRQARCILIDPYANAFMADLSAPPLEWSRADVTEHHRGVAERKWEIDSLCYPIRLSHGYWRATGDTGPFDARWQAAMKLAVETLRVQQRKNGPGPYRFQRTGTSPTESLADKGLGEPVKPVGLIASGFRPSDDACIFPFLVPSNLFAVKSMNDLAEMAHTVLHDDALANAAHALAGEVATALRQYAVVPSEGGTVWAYEVDGFGSSLLMDDANIPSLLALPYLGCSPDPALYSRTRALVWSRRNPWFFAGSAGEGIGGPHEGPGSIWPMSITVYALTSQSDTEIRHALEILKRSSAGTGFMHESFDQNNAAQYTRSWFAWANSLFGELIGTLAVRQPALLRQA